LVRLGELKNGILLRTYSRNLLAFFGADCRIISMACQWHTVKSKCYAHNQLERLHSSHGQESVPKRVFPWFLVDCLPFGCTALIFLVTCSSLPLYEQLTGEILTKQDATVLFKRVSLRASFSGLQGASTKKTLKHMSS
jgi:hypothetical protein